ncbi:unnamed protein product [Oncorhynchus mykiss]|uniref:Secretory carrier-associated membrane protein n=1 Tax=Oncorhynchus mykiss TaxID=8022 RepID=A0A060YLW9_ONCMY|nr:unnamed protein product [Oncorhynchus mykiss]
MSGFDENPFVDAVDVNPFQDASVTQITSGGIETVEEFNPFSASAMGTHTGTTIPISAASSQPAVLQASAVEPTPQVSNRDLNEGEGGWQCGTLTILANNFSLFHIVLNTMHIKTKGRENWKSILTWSYYSSFFCKDPVPKLLSNTAPVSSSLTLICFVSPVHSITLFLNLLACLAYFTADPNAGVDFGLSILWFVLFTPVSFVCWYRPVYKAFRQTGTYLTLFFFFFFVFFFQVSVYIIQCVGIPKWGNSGWISSITMIRSNMAVAVVMMVVAGCFTVNAVLAIILLKMVHSNYRRTGANFTKAQQEFSSGVLTNQTFQSAAASAASSAAQGAFQGR